MTTRLASGLLLVDHGKEPTHLFFFRLSMTPRVPWTAGVMSSLGSSARKWKGEAVWATPTTPLTASSKAPG